MAPVVIDTNVLLVANEQHADVSSNCITACVNRLIGLQATGVVVVDDEFRILGEYQNKTNTKSQKGVGDVFLKWLLQNLSNTTRVQRVSITELSADRFSEFPDDALELIFDPPDRKFVAVANKHPNKPPILQAADCKWLDWWPALQAKGIRVEFLCPSDLCKFYRNKFPEKSVPSLPD